MSGQNTLLIIAEDAQVNRPSHKWNWQVYRDTAIAGSGTYKAMDENGVVEIIGGPGIGGLLFARIPLTADQIKTGNSVPIEAIPSPGVGKSISFIEGNVNYKANDGNLGTGAWNLITDTATLRQADISSFDSSVDENLKFITTTNPGGQNFQLVENKPLMIQLNADSANGTGIAVVYISYRIVTT